jgi:replicative DNA helicase
MSVKKNSMPGRALPHNLNAEKVVLGAMMSSTSALTQCITSVGESHFFGTSSPNQLVFVAIKNLFEKNIPVDLQTTMDELILMNESNNMGGIHYLYELLDSVISLSNLDFYLTILQDHKLLRDFLTTLEGIKSRYEQEEIEEINQFMVQAESEIKKVTELRRIDKFKTALEISQKVQADMNIISRKDGLTGIDIGYKKLNDFTHGLQKGEITIVAARPSVDRKSVV